MKNKYKSLVIFLIPLTIFTILFFTYFPGIITYDGNNQWQQVQSGMITNAHPFFSTFFMLILSKIYNDPSIVLFFQILIFSLLWSYICKNTRKSNKDFYIQIVYTIIMSCIPIISTYSITLWKDVLYSYYLIGLSYIFFVGIDKNFKYNKLELTIISILLFLIYSYRHNGVIVAIFLLIFMLLYLKNKNKKQGIFIFVCFCSLIAIFSIPKKIFLDNSEKLKNDNEVYLSTIDNYIFWMYGAHLNGNNIKSKDDLKFLNSIADTNKWKEVYDPYIINNTNLMDKNEEYAIENINKFRTLFLKTTFQHPLTIVKHYLCSDALLWSPYNQGYVYVYDFVKWDKPFDFSLNSKIPFIRKLYTLVVNCTFIEPINTIFHRPANLMYLSIIIIFILSKSLKNKKLFIVLFPMIANFISLLPINLAQDLRYVYINYLTFFFVLMLLILNINEVKLYLKSKLRCFK